MGWIEKKITDKYMSSNFDRYCNLMRIYWKAEKAIKFIPNVIVNTYLVWRFPFLRFKYADKNPVFHSTCWYWQIDKGWRKAFGIQLCKELKKELRRCKFLRKYEITSVKEKFGALYIYDTGSVGSVHDILNKYEYISARTCIECGRPALFRTSKWEEPYCEECIKDADKKGTGQALVAYKDYDWYGWTK